jgi:predicted dehydrogenase
LEAIKAVPGRTGRIWSVDFSERFEVPSVTKADRTGAGGAIGKVVQTLGQGPHRLNRATRPDWFFEREAYGGILVDIASHQIDQFLFSPARPMPRSHWRRSAISPIPTIKGLQDFGEIALKSDQGHGYIRVDWYTPDALPNWGDGRLTILGTEGYIELRKYVDVGGPEGTDFLVLVNGDRCEKIQCADAGLPYFQNLANDIADRTETAMPQAHAFKVMELGIKAQMIAEGRL